MHQRFQGFVEIYLSNIMHHQGIISNNNLLIYYQTRKQDLDRAYASLQVLIREHNLNGDLYLEIHAATEHPEDFKKFRQELLAFRNKITADKKYCEQLENLPRCLNPHDLMASLTFMADISVAL